MRTTSDDDHYDHDEDDDDCNDHDPGYYYDCHYDVYYDYDDQGVVDNDIDGIDHDYDSHCDDAYYDSH